MLNEQIVIGKRLAEGLYFPRNLLSEYKEQIEGVFIERVIYRGDLECLVNMKNNLIDELSGNE